MIRDLYPNGYCPDGAEDDEPDDDGVTAEELAAHWNLCCWRCHEYVQRRGDCDCWQTEDDYDLPF